MHKSVLLLLTLSMAVGCYGSAPPRPARVPLPQLTPDGQVDVYSETTTTMERVPKTASTCPAGHAEGSPQCTVTRYTVTEPVTRTTSTASYNGEPITYGQFLVITDQRYDAKLSELEKLSHYCRRANIPRYAGMGLMLGGLIAGSAMRNSTGQALMYGGLGAGGGSYAIGYFAYGGRQCNEARALYRQVDMSDRNVTTVGGSVRATEMKVLADQFNARSRVTSTMREARDRQ
jgi:hypothetical protein